MKHSLLETAIGAIVILSAIFFLVYSYSTAHQGAGGVMDGTYRVMAVFDNIGGLKPGDNVMISGVRVGAVDDIELDPKIYRARVSFNISDNVKLARDTSARIASESLLGGKYLDIQPGGDDVDLKNGDVISMTQSATNFEDLLGRFIFSGADKAATQKGPGETSEPVLPSMPTDDHP
jgi:phospholipid/cholesterol/gamma-HCH transport system substrate-binding protein